MAEFLDAGEYIKRLAASQGIDVLNLVKSEETMEQERMAAMQQQQQQALVEQAGALAGSPMADPSKNPALGRGLNDDYDQINGEQAIQTEEGTQEAPPQG
jgi:hypothetical protein